MSVQRWQQIEEIFQSALDLSPTERSKFVSELCSDDVELKKEVEKLLADYDSAESFIEKPVWTDKRFFNSLAKAKILSSLEEELPTETDEIDNLIGTRIGVFELKKEIGRGGMGAVYLAERADGEFSQKVAIKLIKRGMDSDFIVKRFRHERQILASFEHPYIGRLLDGGRTSDGLPYFVMEFIEGDTIYNFCDRKLLNIRERIEIFRRICEAISYAHERQIIHRDIKPGNILVTKDGIPKLLDFGIAKILDCDLIHESVNPTSSFMRLMTPDYASPEQVTGKEITTASDIYSLGVLLYELLTGHRPYNFEGQSLHEISKVVSETLPKLPSRIIDEEANLLLKYTVTTDKFAEVRNTNRQDLKEALTGDLDNIIMKSLAKEPSSRYKTIKEFSGDLEHYLNGEAVGAKEFKRHEGSPFQTRTPGNTKSRSVAVLPFKFINLNDSKDSNDDFLGMGLADALITRLSKIRRFAVRPTSSILAFNQQSIDPIKAGKELEADYILDGNVKRAGERLRVTVQLLNVAENSTVWAASIDETVSDIFNLEDSIATRVVEALLPQITGSELEDYSKRGTENPEAFEKYLRGRYYFNSSTEEGLAKAFVCFHEAINADPNYAHAYVGLSDYHCWLAIFGVLPPKECMQAAIAAAEKAVEIDENSAEPHAALAFAVHAGNYDWSKAEYHLSRALELNPNYATAYAWLAILRFSQGHFTEAFEFADRAIELDPLTPYNHHNVGWGLYYARRFEEGIKQYQQAISHFPNYGLNYFGLSKHLRFVGRTEEALQAIENARNTFGESIFILTAEAECFAANGEIDKAKTALKDLEKLSESRYVSPYKLSLIYCFLKDKEKALDLLEEALEVGEPWLNWLGVEPVFDFIRDEPRFQSILEKMGYQFFFNDLSISDDKTIRLTKSHHIHTTETKLFDENDDSLKQTIANTPAKKRFWQKPLVYIVIILFLLSSFSIFHFYRNSQYQAASNSNIGFLQSNSIAILPFKAEDSADEHLGSGLADALSNRLGYIRRLSVVAPNSARSVKADSASEIGKQLKVSYFLRGNLQKDSNNIKVAAELVNPSDETILWKEDFTATDGDLFEIQTQIAEKIWTTLGVEPLPTELQQISKVYTKDASAYDLYLIGRYQLTNRSPENIKKAINTFKQAIEIDPDFALAYAGLADAYALLKSYEFPPPADVHENAKKNALKALELDDNLVEAHTSLAYIKFYNERDREGAELEFRRAIQLNPSYSQAHHWFGLLLITKNRSMDAVGEMKTAVELDPNSYIVKTALAMAYFYNKQYDETIKECEIVLAENKEFLPALRVLRWAYLMKKDYKSARAVFQKEFSHGGGETDDPGWSMIIAQVESLGENKQEITEKLNRAVEDPLIKNALPAFSYENALAYNMLGEKEKALKWLETAESSGDNGFVLLEVDPRFENLRNEPRFQTLLKKLKR